MNAICSSPAWEMFSFSSGDCCLKLSPLLRSAGARRAPFSRRSAAMERSPEEQGERRGQADCADEGEVITMEVQT